MNELESELQSLVERYTIREILEVLGMVISWKHKQKLEAPASRLRDALEDQHSIIIEEDQFRHEKKKPCNVCDLLASCREKGK